MPAEGFRPTFFLRGGGKMSADSKNILVCGGAGYIGSHMVRLLAEHGYAPVVLDDFSMGHVEAVSGFPVIRASLADREALRQALRKHAARAVMHFAGKAQVGESVVNPALYYDNNPRMNHFYTEEEKALFLKKWAKNIR